MWEQMVLATGYQASLVTLPANEASIWLAQQLGGVIKMDFGPVRNLDAMVGLYKIELSLQKSELKIQANKSSNPNLGSFRNLHMKLFGPIQQGVWKHPVYSYASINRGVIINFRVLFSCYLPDVIITDQWYIRGM